jgi:hypothetical protein
MRATVIREAVIDGVLVLRDLDHGMSVTNDAEAVVAWALTLPGWDRTSPIVYRDTDGRYDALVHSQGRFVGFLSLGGRHERLAGGRSLELFV